MAHEHAAGAGPAELLPGLWRFQERHPDWTKDDGGEDGWEPVVAWWAIATSGGLLLVDPLVFDWEPLDRLVSERGGCAGVVRMLHWHQRSVAGAAARYETQVIAARTPTGKTLRPLQRALGNGEELTDGIRAFAVERDDEIALWLPAQAALLLADVILGDEAGGLRLCPPSWTQPPGGRERAVELLEALARLPVEHVLVSHGPPVLGGGAASLCLALAAR